MALSTRTWRARIGALWSARSPVQKQALIALGAAAFVALADPSPGAFIAGAALVSAGALIRVWAYGHLEKNRALATSGPYAYTRNPAYFGTFVALIGLFLAAGDPWTVAGVIPWLIGLVAVAVFLGVYMPAKYEREYPRLRAAFGPRFAEHEANVPHLFPRLTPWCAAPAKARFAGSGCAPAAS